MNENYHTIQTIYEALRRCKIPCSYTKNQIEEYAKKNKLFVKIDEFELSLGERRSYSFRGIRRLIRESDLQMIIDGLQIPIKLSDVKTTLNKIYTERQTKRK
ncbi:hypothetical protein J4221_04020 [Candidatus Pacearchaeota archaeon]|nr:hypothetical protein [Candidatus Pacearchaeota archaeon]